MNLIYKVHCRPFRHNRQPHQCILVCTGTNVHMTIVWYVPAALSPLTGTTITVQVAAQRERLGLALLQEGFCTWSNLTVFFSHKIIVHRGSVPYVTLHCLDNVSQTHCGWIAPTPGARVHHRSGAVRSHNSPQNVPSACFTCTAETGMGEVDNHVPCEDFLYCEFALLRPNA